MFRKVMIQNVRSRTDESLEVLQLTRGYRPILTFLQTLLSTIYKKTNLIKKVTGENHVVVLA